MKNTLILSIVLAALSIGCERTRTISDLPASNAARTIKDIKDNDSGWVDSSSMWVDGSGHCFIRENDPIMQTPPNDNAIYLTRQSDGYIVDIASSQAKWTKAGATQNSYDATSPGSGGDCAAIKEFRNTPRDQLRK
jgi:hypothetical protein